MPRISNKNKNRDTSSLEKSGGLVPLSELEIDDKPKNPYGDHVAEFAVSHKGITININIFSKGVHVGVHNPNVVENSYMNTFLPSEVTKECQQKRKK
jgi:hypothetical protein